jgi:hypothetical protein
MKKIILLLVFGSIFFYSCSDNGINEPDGPTSGDNNNNNNGPGSDGTWRVDKNLVFDGGPGKDGIPALVNPTLINPGEASYLQDDDLVLGLKYGNQVIAYPHRILDWHEIINVDIGDLSIAIVYCPLTGTGVGWDRVIKNEKTTFGVSGLLYKNNIIPFDRATDSNWSQLRLECINGSLIGEVPKITVLPEMPWSLWKKLFPDSKVVGTDTGHQRTYFEYPYGNYKTNNAYLIFPSDALTQDIPVKERVHAIIVANFAKVYRFNKFENGKVIKDIIKTKDYIIVGNKDFIVSFELDENTSNLDFTYDFNDTEIILTDNEGNKWNIFGEALSGPRQGTFLKAAKTSMMAYYFSIENFYPDVRIYN